MDFFDREARAQKQTRRPIWLFGLAVLAVTDVLLCPLAYCFAHPVFTNGPAWHPINFFATALYIFGDTLMQPVHFCQLVFHWRPVFWISLGTLVSIAAGSYYRIRELSDGGSVVAQFLGGRRVAAQPEDLDEQKLRRVVEETAIASGTPVPEIYVLDCERGINAFAAGHTRDDEAARERQMQILQANLEPADFAQFTVLVPQITALGEPYKLPPAEVSGPALRENEPEAHRDGSSAS